MKTTDHAIFVVVWENINHIC